MKATAPGADRVAAPEHAAALPGALVIPDRVGGWCVQREGEDRPLSAHNSETAAEDAAVREARVTGTSEVVVHDRYDRVHRAER